MIAKTLTVSLGERSYPIYIGSQLLQDIDLVLQQLVGTQVFIVSNAVVAAQYLDTFKSALGDLQCDICILPDGEVQKSFAQWQTVLDKLIENGHRRNTTIIALGGGVVGDIAGFAAACYQRGVDYIQVPTTLLAQVDSSVGGKTAINHSLGKNIIGAFHQPKAVLIDVDYLQTLPAREYCAGFAEIIKYGLIYDESFFDWLQNNVQALLEKDYNALVYAITRSCEIKSAIVAQDEKESGVRAILNFGHTYAHALEAITDYQSFLHGEAVALGMLFACQLSECKLGLDPVISMQLKDLLASFGLPNALASEYDHDVLVQAMLRDKKNQTSNITFVLIKSIGEVVIKQLDSSDV